jgi:hypothetical protein
MVRMGGRSGYAKRRDAIIKMMIFSIYSLSRESEAKLVDHVSAIANDSTHNGQLFACMFLLNTVHGYRQLVGTKHSGEVEHKHNGGVDVARSIEEWAK